jgi:hypothetical protein
MRGKLLLLFVLSLSRCAGSSAKDGIPHVVKRFNLYHQTGAIGPVTLYTPKQRDVSGEHVHASNCWKSGFRWVLPDPWIYG